MYNIKYKICLLCKLCKISLRKNFFNCFKKMYSFSQPFYTSCQSEEIVEKNCYGPNGFIKRVVLSWQIMQKITFLLRISLGPHHCCSIQSTNLHHNLFSNVFFIKISSFQTKQTFVRKTKIQTYSATTTSCQNNNLHIWKDLVSEVEF